MSCLRRCLWPTLCVVSVAAAETVAKVLRVAKKCGLKHVSPTTPGIDLIIEVGADCREVEVDLSLPENKNPQTAREQSEFIEVELVPLEGLRVILDSKAQDGWTIDARLYT